MEIVSLSGYHPFQYTKMMWSEKLPDELCQRIMEVALSIIASISTILLDLVFITLKYFINPEEAPPIRPEIMGRPLPIDTPQDFFNSAINDGLERVGPKRGKYEQAIRDQIGDEELEIFKWSAECLIISQLKKENNIFKDTNEQFSNQIERIGAECRRLPDINLTKITQKIDGENPVLSDPETTVLRMIQALSNDLCRDNEFKEMWPIMAENI